MGILDWLGAGDTIAKPIDAIANVYEKVASNDQQKAAAAQALEMLRQNPQDLQIELNKLEAQNPQLFVSGWRPFIGWIGGVSLALYFIPQFILADMLWFKLCMEHGTLVAFPINSDSLMQLVYLLLGFGGYHTLEKKWNKTK